ncbi:MAG: hypothetical protein ACUVXA_02645 [Candidatus Jordarchaeum sp.]|uniref:hypothetical protein n=1 Tax=Candidatus Jordarchaeum sp. TaxID=2823881 RepID=UPI00404A917F
MVYEVLYGGEGAYAHDTFGWCVTPKPAYGCCKLVRGCEVPVVQQLLPLKVPPLILGWRSGE